MQLLAEAAEAMAQSGFTPQQMVRVMGGEAVDLAPLEPGESRFGSGILSYILCSTEIMLGLETGVD